MPETQFEHSVLEQDIERLASEVKDKKAASEEAAKQAVSSAVKEVYHPQAGVPTAPAPSQSSSLPNYMTNEPSDVKLEVENLIDVTWHKGVLAGLKEAKKKGPLVLDAFHDALVDKLYGELKKRGHIK